MSTRNYDTGWCVGKRLIDISGNFVPLTGAGTVVASTVKGFGFGYAPVNGVMTLRPLTGGNNPVPKSTPGIVRSSTGLYAITFEDPYIDIVYFGVDLAAPSTGTALWAQPVEPVTGINTAFTAPTLSVLIVNNAGTPTDAAANMRIYFDVVFRDSTAFFQKP
jgi:hypothetical protein